MLGSCENAAASLNSLPVMTANILWGLGEAWGEGDLTMLRKMYSLLFGIGKSWGGTWRVRVGEK